MAPEAVVNITDIIIKRLETTVDGVNVLRPFAVIAIRWVDFVVKLNIQPRRHPGKYLNIPLVIHLGYKLTATPVSEGVRYLQYAQPNATIVTVTLCRMIPFIIEVVRTSAQHQFPTQTATVSIIEFINYIV